MDYRERFRVKPGSRVKLSEVDAGYKGKHNSESHAEAEIEHYRDQLNKQQYLPICREKTCAANRVARPRRCRQRRYG